MTGKIITAAIIFFTLLFFLSWHNKNRLPDSSKILPELKSEPVQTPVELAPFQITKDKITYTITPKFEYDIYGMVVTYHEAGSFLDISHKDWKDVINIKDLCVLWGSNTENNIYKKIRFTSGDFTCEWRTWDEATWKAFRNNQASNNHLITADGGIAKKILRSVKGDQIHIRGYLAEYTHGGGFNRGTSTTRDDGGPGACETIYVTDFQVLNSYNRPWAMAMNFSLFSILGLVILSVVLFLTGTHE